MGLAAGDVLYSLIYTPNYALNPQVVCPIGSSQLLDVREVRGLAAGDVLMLVVMEWCDLGSLASAIAKRKFQPHGKWAFRTTYVRTAPRPLL